MSDQSSRLPILRRYYDEYLADGDVAAYIRNVSRHYTTATLERLAVLGNAPDRRAAVFAIGLLGEYESNALLGRALRDPDPTVRSLADDAIRAVWRRAGNEYQRRRLEIILRLNASEHYQEAARLATDLIEQAPWFAEAWNQRAVSHFHLGHLAESIRDCHQALEINPHHYGAAIGMGHCYLRLGQPTLALECFQRALQLNPGLDGIRAHAERIAKSLNENG